MYCNNKKFLIWNSEILHKIVSYNVDIGQKHLL